MAGLDGSKEVLLPLSANAQNTLVNLARQSACQSLKVSPFCHVGDNSDVRGWVLDMSGETPASVTPLNCSLFDGVSIVECDCTEAEALQRLTKPEQTRAELGMAIHSIMSQVTEDRRATWRRCRPTENGVPPSLYSAILGRDNKVTLCTTPDAIPLMDSEPWMPELSPEGFIGLFHQWHPVRKRLCLYMACQSYLPKACLEFADLVRDLGDSCTTWDVLHSEEAQWLRQACARNRARLLAMGCEAMGLRYPCMLDYCNAEQGKRMAVVQIETLHHDILMLPGKHQTVRLLNHCAGGHQESIICSMAPWEGLWLFRGEKNASKLFLPTCTPSFSYVSAHKPKKPASMSLLKCTFTSPQKVTADRMEVLHLWEHQKQEASFLQQHCLMVCEEDPQHMGSVMDEGLSQLMMMMGSQQAQQEEEDEEEIMLAYKRSIARRMSSIPARKAQKAQERNDIYSEEEQQRLTNNKEYLVFDEHILQTMVHRGWNRSLGYTVLMPLAYGQCKDWWKHKLMNMHI